MTVAALAGRRLDQDGTIPARFPRSSVKRVRDQIENLLISEQVDLLICSAASGSDLLALEIAQKLNVRCRIVLPFEASRFRKTSVVDRSAEWGPFFDRILAHVEASGDLVIIDSGLDQENAYAHATEVIVDEARRAALPESALAILVWDGKSRRGFDYAQQFLKLALQAEMKQRVVLTL